MATLYARKLPIGDSCSAVLADCCVRWTLARDRRESSLIRVFAAFLLLGKVKLCCRGERHGRCLEGDRRRGATCVTPLVSCRTECTSPLKAHRRRPSGWK